MSPYTIITGITSLTFFLTGLFVYTRDKKRPVYQRCYLFSLSVSLWALGYFLTLLGIPDYKFNIISSRLSHACGAFIPIAYLDFVWAILNKKRERKFFLLSYSFSSIMFLMCFTPFVVKTVLPKMGFPFYPEWGVLYPIYAGSYLFFPGYAEFEMWRAIRRSTGTERTRLIYFFLALALAFSGGISLFLLIFNVQFPPYCSALIITYPPTMAYTILVHKFLDIDVIIKRTLVFAGVVTISVLAISLPTALVQMVIGRAIGISPFFLMVCGIAVTVLIYRPVENYLIDLTDKFLFQKKFHYAQILRQASKDIATVTSFQDLTRRMLAVLSRKARTRNAIIYVRADERNGYELRGLIGYRKMNRPNAFLEERQAIVQFLIHTGKPVTKYVLLDQIRNAREESEICLYRKALETLTELRGEVIVPSFASADLSKERTSSNQNQHLQGILILGGKKSDEDYYEEDIDMLAMLAHEHGTRFELIKLFDEVLRVQEARLVAERKAELINHVRTLSHETGNTLVGIISAATNLQMHFVRKLKTLLPFIEKGVEKGILKSYVKATDDIEQTADTIRRSGVKVQKIFATATSRLKEEEELMEGVYVGLIWADAKRSVSIEKEGIRTITNIPDDFYVYANVSALERVFVNLLANSRDALRNTTDKKINLDVCQKAVDGKSVALFEYYDNGSGIPLEFHGKVFEQDFSTKPKPRNVGSLDSGHGQGLYVCKRNIEEVHHGKIWIDPNYKGGVKFLFWIPLDTNDDTA